MLYFEQRARNGRASARVRYDMGPGLGWYGPGLKVGMLLRTRAVHITMHAAARKGNHLARWDTAYYANLSSLYPSPATKSSPIKPASGRHANPRAI